MTAPVFFSLALVSFVENLRVCIFSPLISVSIEEDVSTSSLSLCVFISSCPIAKSLPPQPSTIKLQKYTHVCLRHISAPSCPTTKKCKCLHLSL